MPRTIGVVQRPGLFEDLLSRLGVNRPTQPFTLDGDIVPVILVDSGVAFVASPTPAYRILDWFTAGPQVAPAAGFVMADTGPLPVGDYTVKVIVGSGDVANQALEWRDVPNAATLRRQALNTTPTDRSLDLTVRLRIENAGERFRVVMVLAGVAANTYQVSILAKL